MYAMYEALAVERRQEVERNLHAARVAQRASRLHAARRWQRLSAWSAHRAAKAQRAADPDGGSGPTTG